MASDKHKSKQARRVKKRPFLESVRLLTYSLVASVVLALLAVLAGRLDGLQALLLHMGFLSAVTFAVFGLDKLHAGNQKRRASELNLLALSALGGAAGGLLGMAVFRHKTQRPLFTIGLTVLLFIHGVIIAVMFMS